MILCKNQEARDVLYEYLAVDDEKVSQFISRRDLTAFKEENKEYLALYSFVNVSDEWSIKVYRGADVLMYKSPFGDWCPAQTGDWCPAQTGEWCSAEA